MSENNVARLPETLVCVECGRLTDRGDAVLRRFNTGKCVACGGRLDAVRRDEEQVTRAFDRLEAVATEDCPSCSGMGRDDNVEHPGECPRCNGTTGKSAD